jgi:AraC family transcriptional regulator
MQGNSFNTTHKILSIKNMVSKSCIKIVQQELERIGFIKVLNVELGTAEINYDAQIIGLDVIDSILKRSGFELLRDTEGILVGQIKSAVIEHIFYGSNTNSLIRNSDYLSERLEQPYPYLSKVFKERTGTTLEKYIILIKIERIKELITYNEHSLSEISYMMGYSSVQYLSNQFKQVTGYTVSVYKENGGDRKVLGEVI